MARLKPACLSSAVGGDDMVRTTLKSFEKRAPQTLQNLKEAFERGDYVKLRRDAHSLKGACGYVASEHLRESILQRDAPV